MNKNTIMYGCFKHTVIQSLHLNYLHLINQKEKNMPHYAKKNFFYTKYYESRIGTGCKQPSRWIRVYDTGVAHAIQIHIVL